MHMYANIIRLFQVSLRALDPAVSTVESTDIASGFECSSSTRNMSSTGVLADATLSVLATESRCNTDAVMQTAPISHSHRSKVTESTSYCDCTPFHRVIVSEQLASKLHTHPNDENAVFRTIEDAVNAPESLGGICFIHLRHMATSLKLNNSMEGASRPALEYRLRYCLKNKQRLSSVRKLYGHWFHSSARTDSVRRKLGSAKYAPSPITAIEVDQRRLWEKYGRPGAMEEWEQNGTINIENIFDYVLKDDDAMAMVHTEFAMYEYHYHASGDPGSHKGWLRNMWYSLIQQLVRMDPVYYLITVASRPDSNTWLISYPYYTKSTAPGHETGFLHLDLHAEQFVQDGKGGNITQGAVTLTDEDVDNCTVLVPGFHRQIRAWVKDNLAIKRRKGQGHNTHVQNRVQTGTTGVKQGAWTSEMARKYGDLIPVPNKAGGVRISRPDILHGSTGKASIVRRVVFPWFTGIRPDHSTLDNIESETWEQLALCHLQRIPCKLSPSGKSVSSRTTSNIEQIFRASVELQYPDSSTYPIGM